jgi:predicted alpha-1,6-mannanase (GH76 family)
MIIGNANAAIEQVQGWYNSDTGLWGGDTVGNNWWHSANVLTALIDFMLITGSSAYKDVIEITFNKNHDSGFLNEYYDDEGWWALGWIKAYDLTKDEKYLKQAETIFGDMSTGNASDNVCKGGIYWQKNHCDPRGKKPYKNAIANELFFATAAALYRRNNDQKYLEWANNEWKWFNESGLINNDNLINDSLTTSASQQQCINDETTDVWTYNQGVILGALSDLFLCTGETRYLDKATQIAEALIGHSVVVNPDGSSRSGVIDGILSEWKLEGDLKQFKGIFVRNLGYLYKLRPLARYRAFLALNATAALAHANPANQNQFGADWRSPFDTADYIRQSSGIDLLNAANSVPSEVNYNSLRAFVLASGISFPASVRKILNGAGSLRSVLLN